MAVHPEEEAILKPIWTPLPELVGRQSKRWRLLVLGPAPREGAWYPRDASWVWKWMLPQSSDHGEWIWEGEQPMHVPVPGTADFCWRLLSKTPRLSWQQSEDSFYERLRTLENGVLAFDDEQGKLLQFMSWARPGAGGTDDAMVVLEEDPAERPLHVQLIDRMKKLGSPLSKDLEESVTRVASSPEYFAEMREQAAAALQFNLETALELAAAQGHAGSADYFQLLARALNVDMVEYIGPGASPAPGACPIRAQLRSGDQGIVFRSAQPMDPAAEQWLKKAHFAEMLFGQMASLTRRS